MRINIKTVKEEKLDVEADASATIGQVKELVEKKYQHQKDWQMLIFAGQMLPDDKTIQAIGLTEKDFMVMMIKKPRETKKPAASATPAAAPTPAAPATPAPAVAAVNPPAAPEKKKETTTSPGPATPVQPAPVAAATPSQAAPVQAPAAPAAANDADILEQQMFVTKEEAEASVAMLCDMGFPRDQVILALRAGYFNPHRAVEYLTSGMPIPAPQPVAPPRQAAPATPARQAAPAPPAAAPRQAPPAGAAAGPFDFLRQHPQFQTLRAIAQRDPSALEQILGSLAQSNPELLQLIAQHQDEFIRLLTGPDAPGQGGAAPGGQQLPPGFAPGPQPGTVQIQASPEDMENINRLVDFGFERNRAMEAYFLLGRDVQAAADFLANNPDDESMDFMGGDFEGGDGDGDGDDEEGYGDEGPQDF